MAKVKVNIKPKYKRWYEENPEGTEEEKKECYDIAQEYMYKLLDYSEKDEDIPKEEIDKHRRLFSYLKQGPWVNHHSVAQRCKITSAEALYILTTTIPSKILGAKLGINPRKVNEIRRGETLTFYDEYLLVRRITGIVRSRLKNKGDTYKKVYKLSKLTDKNTYEEQLLTTSSFTARKLREAIIPKKDYHKLVANKTLDIMYPIVEVDVI